MMLECIALSVYLQAIKRYGLNFFPSITVTVVYKANISIWNTLQLKGKFIDWTVIADFEKITSNQAYIQFRYDHEPIVLAQRKT